MSTFRKLIADRMGIDVYGGFGVGPVEQASLDAVGRVQAEEHHAAIFVAETRPPDGRQALHGGLDESPYSKQP